MVGCSAAGCSNRWEQKVKMYGFPSDPERRRMWLFRARRDDFKPSPTQSFNNYKLCEVHFEEDQFCLTRKGSKKLRSDAVPTVFAHRPPAKRRRPPTPRYPPPPETLRPPTPRYTPPPPETLVRRQAVAQICGEHGYCTKKDAAPVVSPPAPQHHNMDFFSMLKMHAIDIVQFHVQGADDMRESELVQTPFKPSQPEREPVSPDSQSEREPVSPDSPPSPAAASACQSPERETRERPRAKQRETRERPHVKRRETRERPHVKRREPQPDMSQVVEVCAAPVGLELEHADLLSAPALSFLQELVCTFDQEVDQVMTLRVSRKAHLDMTGELPEFSEGVTPARGGRDPGWRVSPVPPRLARRHVDVGDLAPCDTQRLIAGLQSPAQGLQIDFDDGNCPTYHNQIKGLHNVYKAVHGLLSEAPPIQEAPVLMLRPRAWNMVEHNMMVSGKEVPGPLFDFGLLMFHCGRKLSETQSGPFFYLSKVESYHEARLWNNIFVWTQDKGTIKATVLIENVLAAFQMEDILFELKEHSAGLNCGIWDYSASFINKFGHRSEFVLPDRRKYVNMQKLFLRSYMDLLVQTCHRRGALATGGMAATLMPTEAHSTSYRTLLDTVTRLKLLEIQAGVDGFMVYDLSLIEPMQKLFQTHSGGDNQLDRLRDDVTVTAEDLLTMPSGGVTLHGLQYNITVGVLFIDAWLSGKGHFFYRGQVEDSATAEISRSQVWQWIRHQTRLEDDGRTVTRALVTDLTLKVTNQLLEVTHKHHARVVQRLTTAANMFLEVVQRRDFPEFLTTYLNLDHTFLSSHAQGGGAPQSPAPPPQANTVPLPPKLTTRPDPAPQHEDHPATATAKPQNTTPRRQLPTLTPRPQRPPKPASKL